MNKELLQKNLDIYNKIIRKIDETNPKIARKVYNKVNYIIFTVLNYYRMKDILGLKEAKSIIQIYKILLDEKFISDEEVKYVEKFIDDNEEILIEVFDIAYECTDIFQLYEEILSLDIRAENNYYCVVKENKHRDRAGAYYTSKDFAYKITEKTIERYMSEKCNISIDEYKDRIISKDETVINILRNSVYVDLSCGTGSFIISFIEYIKKYIDDKITLNKIISNIYGFDIDIVALQIIKTQLIIYSQDINMIKTISSNFILGNTLIQNEKESYLKKLELFSEGFIYHIELGIDQNKYEDKFDVILGNPPWEKIRFEDKNFFANYCPRIAEINKKNIREKEIQKLSCSNPKLLEYYSEFVEQIENCKNQIKKNNKLLHSANGELNTYSLFVELAVRLLNNHGYISLIVKSGLITAPANSKIFNYLLDNKLIVSIDDFINRNKLFPIDSRERFTVITLKKYYENEISLRMMLKSVIDLDSKEPILINKDILNVVNPINNMIPNISSGDQMLLLNSFYKKFNVFEEEFPKCKFGRLVHLTNHAEYIKHNQEENTLPIYEGKFIEIYDNKFSTFNGMKEEDKYKSKASSRLMTEEEKNNKEIFPESRFYIEKDKWCDISKNYQYKYSIVWRSLTSTTNRRTMIASILPHSPTIQSIQLLQYEDDYEKLVIILSIFNSCVFDYLVRLKLNGIDLTQSVIKQIPVPAKKKFDQMVTLNGNTLTIKDHIICRVKYLYRNDYRLNEVFINIDENNLYEDFKEDDRKVILELDYLISITYELDKSKLISIMKTFDKYYNSKDINFVKHIK